MQHTTRLVQLISNNQRRVAVVEEPSLIILSDTDSIYNLALEALSTSVSLADLIARYITKDVVSYNEVYEGRSEWKLLPSFDVPDDPFRCLVAGTGLTHKNSALNRQMMHQASEGKQDEATDSMRIYQWGVEGGWPEPGKIGVQPEWFYKGSGQVLRPHGGELVVPPFGNDGGEEPEIAGVYIIDKKGNPHRIGFTTANEFSDHVMEKKNYLYLAPSKLRNCSIGPELVIDGDFSGLTGTVAVYRDNKKIWSADVKTGEQNMAHSLANLEYHHFKYSGHRVPLQAHVHFFGADAFSFGAGVHLQDGDVTEVNWNGMGRALRNTIRFDSGEETIVSVKPMQMSKSNAIIP